MVERDGATAVSEGNIDNASASEFSDIGGHDLHLAPNASAIAAGVAPGVSLAPEDIDGDARSDPPSVGADEP
jgi:hypothetical protein